MVHGRREKGAVGPKEGRKTFRRLVAYLARSKGELAVVLVLVVITIASSLVGSYMLRPIINDYIMPGDVSGAYAGGTCGSLSRRSRCGRAAVQDA